MDDHDHDDHAGSHYGGGGGGGPARSDYSDPYGGSAVGGASTVSAYQDNPFRQHEAAAANPFESDTEYHSGGVSAAGRYAPPTATDAFDDDARPARFPRANYDRIGGH